jgi:hypothetical protein
MQGRGLPIASESPIRRPLASVAFQQVDDRIGHQSGRFTMGEITYSPKQKSVIFPDEKVVEALGLFRSIARIRRALNLKSVR